MTTITLNNEEKTKVTFEYQHGLPYKKSIRPEIEYGDWEENDKITIIVVKFSNEEYCLFSNTNDIEILNKKKIKNEYWIDLNDIYLVMPINKQLQQAFQTNKFLFAFMYKNNLLASAGYIE